MGNCCTQEFEERESGASRNSKVNHFDLIMGSENDGGEMSQRKYDEIEVAKLIKELKETPQIFVLNNLLMSIMFFENFEKEKLNMPHSSLTSLEKELNAKLRSNETTECIVPDVVFEHVNKNVRFRRLHGVNKHRIEPLCPRRMFVINDNIDVLESTHTPQYTAIDKPNYQAVIENSEEHSGFVKLRCTTNQLRKISFDKEAPVESQPGPSSQPDDSETYTYSTFANLNTPKPLDVTDCERRDTLPKTCFTYREVKKYDKKVDDSEDEEEDQSQPPQKDYELYEDITYVSSNGFMKYFQNAIFPNSLGKTLGFDASEISLANAIPGKIFCNLQDVDEDFSLLPCEIIPSIAIQWPVELTFEFHDRAERPTMWDKFGEEYRWPQVKMIGDIRTMNCVLVPRGCIPKKGENKDSDIEWEVGFPKAQKYLDTHMSHTQIRAFLFLLTLYKSYIEPTNKQFDGILVDHIRTHMYWECESNPRDWPEHRLGTKLVLVIQHLIQRLAARNLPDFFIKRKNTFLNVPNKHLNHAQKIFHDILESPAVYFLGALRNLRYNGAKFYPQVDFKRLYQLLTAPPTQLVNPRMLDMRPPNLRPQNRRPIKVEGDNNYRKEIAWKVKQEKLNRERVLQKKLQEKLKEENLINEKRGSVDSIDFGWQCEKQFHYLKIREILVFFITHFIEMAKRSRKLATQRQALFYTKQATYLTKLLESFGSPGDAQDLYEIVMKEEDTSKKLSVNESFEHPPSTPKRNSSQYSWEMTQQVKSNNINLTNLNKSYNNTAVPFNKLKKNPSALSMKARPAILRANHEDRRRSGEVRRSVVGFSEEIDIR